MSRVLRPVAPLAVVLMLLAGCGETEGPVRRAGDDATTSSTTPTEGSTEDPVDVALYDADFTVGLSGDLRVVETLTLDVPVDDRHGIYRTFEAGVAVQDCTATLDGGETPVADSVENGERVFKIGDPDQTLSVGQHVVRMEYGVADVLASDASAAGVQHFDWQLVPDGWDLDIEAADLTVHLPAEATNAACTVGRSDPCQVSGVGTTTLGVSARDLEEHTSVRLQADLNLD